MAGRPILQTLRIRNLLSYGADGQETELKPLNVLIGPNASGKSNLIETLGVLQAAPNDLTAPIREGGGIREWLWKGAEGTPIAEVEAVVDYPGVQPLRYRLGVTMTGQRLEVVDEVVENAYPLPGHNDVYFFYRYQNGRPALNVRTAIDEPAGTYLSRVQRRLPIEDLSPHQSVLSQRKDPDQYPELTLLNKLFSGIHLYREWNFGRYTAPRLPQRADLPEDFLLEDASNLGLVVNSLQHHGQTKHSIITRLQELYEGVSDITTRIQGGTVQLFVHEKGLREPIPATRLSDGTLRYLCLLTILLHPSPPPVICMEEPELGLHPDIMPKLAELLIAASRRTQLIVTTHSDELVSALSEVPEAVLVCERDEGGSRLRRLDPEPLKVWLEKYSLGDLWAMGELGGTRW